MFLKVFPTYKLLAFSRKFGQWHAPAIICSILNFPQTHTHEQTNKQIATIRKKSCKWFEVNADELKNIIIIVN